MCGSTVKCGAWFCGVQLAGGHHMGWKLIMSEWIRTGFNVNKRQGQQGQQSLAGKVIILTTFRICNLRNVNRGK